MAITTQDGLVAAMAAGQLVLFNRGSMTATAAGWMDPIAQPGNPGAGVLAGTNTANGLVPDDATAGFPPINAFTGANTGYMSAIDYGCTVACRLRLVDLLFKAGAYAFNANVTLASQPSYATRVPGGDYKGTELWIEAATAFTGNLSINVGYQNQDDVAKTTGVIATGVAPIAGRMIQLPLAAGDSGIRRINSVVATVATVGTFNVLVVRPLWMGRVRAANEGWTHGPDMTDLPVLFANSALLPMVCPDSTATGVFDMQIGVVNG